MSTMLDGDNPLSKRKNTGLVRLRTSKYVVPDDSVPEAFAERRSLHRHRVFGHGVKVTHLERVVSTAKEE